MLQYVVPLEPSRSRGIARLSTGLPLSSGLSGGKVRSLSSLAVSADTMGTAAVEAGKEWLAAKTHLQGGRKTVQAVTQLLLV